MDGKVSTVVASNCRARPCPGVRHLPKARRLPRPRASFVLQADAEHFQPVRVLLSSVADQVRAFYLAFRRIALGEID